MLEKELLDILACPKCKGDLRYEQEKDILVCENCQVYYEIREGIPVLLIEETKPLPDSEGNP
ncbi:Trm112 family protein [Aquifex pyrophilus]